MNITDCAYNITKCAIEILTSKSPALSFTASKLPTDIVTDQSHLVSSCFSYKVVEFDHFITMYLSEGEQYSVM